MNPAKQTAPLCVPVILSGGMGTRLWPMSRGGYPKQFLNLHRPDLSLIQETVMRVSDRTRFASPILVCNQDHRFLVAEKLHEIGVKHATILLEPMGRNTAPALAAAAYHIQKRYGDDAIMLVLPSDHIIKNDMAFQQGVAQALATAKSGYLTTFGITPTLPATGYGYIKKGAAIGETGGYAVAEFVEKPDAATAESYLASGEYAWNSGMFCFPTGLFLSELEQYQPEMAKLSLKSIEQAKHDTDFIRLNDMAFSAIKSDSVDYAVMERTQKAAIVPMECGWTDAGSFDALWETQEQDAEGNAALGENYLMDAKNCYINSNDGVKIAALGVENLVIISTKDCVMVADKSRAQDVKNLVDKIKLVAPELVEQYRQMYRPWGHYDSINEGDRHQVKRIVVNPGAKLSLQMHYHRAEHWIVVSGTAIVTVGDETQTLTENQSVYIPCGATHRLENPGRIPLELIEVQSGSYLGEDDIVRFEDTYGRTEQTVA